MKSQGMKKGLAIAALLSALSAASISAAQAQIVFGHEWFSDLAPGVNVGNGVHLFGNSYGYGYPYGYGFGLGYPFGYGYGYPMWVW